MATDPLDRLRVPNVPLSPSAEFADGLAARIHRALGPMLAQATPQPRKDDPMETMVNAPTITPSVQYRDARAGMRWLTEILDFRVAAVYDDPDGGVAHAQLVWRTGMIFVSTRREEGPFADTGPSMIALAAPDSQTVDRYYERAKAAGADIVYPLTDEAYGSHEFTMRDREGNLWTIGTYQPEIPNT